MVDPVWISKDSNGNLTGVYANPQSFPVTQTTPDDPVVVAFLSPKTIIPNISRRQFYQQLAVQGIIQNSDAIAVLSTGTLPAALAAIVAKLPAAEQFQAQMFLLGGDIYQRNTQIVNDIGTLYGMTSAQMDAFFIAAGAL